MTLHIQYYSAKMDELHNTIIYKEPSPNTSFCMYMRTEMKNGTPVMNPDGTPKTALILQYVHSGKKPEEMTVADMHGKGNYQLGTQLSHQHSWHKCLAETKIPRINFLML